MTRHRRTGAVLGGGVVVGVLLLGSTAFACANFLGKATWRGDNAASNDTVTVGANAGGMSFCTGYAPTDPAGTPSGAVVSSGAGNGALTITVDNAPAGCTAGHLSAATYTLNGLHESFSSTYPTGTLDPCGALHGSSTPYNFGTWAVGGTGPASHTFTAGNGNKSYWDTTGDWAMCLSTANIADGIASWVAVV